MSCTESDETQKSNITYSKLQPVDFDYDRIQSRDTLNALARFNANSYFLYRGEPMGFEYELLNLFCSTVDLKLNMVIPKTWMDLDSLLYVGVGDVIATNFTITKERSKRFAFTVPLIITKQVLIQRKPDNWLNLKEHEIEALLIRDPIDLIDKTVYVRENSSYEQRLRHLSEEIGADIHIKTVSGEIETEELIADVSSGKIDYTVADENIAISNYSTYSNIDTKTVLSLSQRIAWAVRPNSDSLLNVFNRWITNLKQSNDPTFNLIYQKYYGHARSQKRSQSEYYTSKTGKISQYDKLIKQYAANLPIDWLLLASQIYQESQFDPKTKSWAGAIGLMQLMPQTIKDFKVKNPYSPKENMRGGTEYLKRLFDYWNVIPDSLERIKFVLASYNSGIGHIDDARSLAEKYYADKNRWDDNVALFILRKSQRKYYEDPVVKFGYCRGDEVFNYVKEILQRYENYKQFVN